MDMYKISRFKENHKSKRIPLEKNDTKRQYLRTALAMILSQECKT